jgi:hypothetical protein
VDTNHAANGSMLRNVGLTKTDSHYLTINLLEWVTGKRGGAGVNEDHEGHDVFLFFMIFMSFMVEHFLAQNARSCLSGS